jgi:hypothetical protein
MWPAAYGSTAGVAPTSGFGSDLALSVVTKAAAAPKRDRTN